MDEYDSVKVHTKEASTISLMQILAHKELVNIINYTTFLNFK